MFTTKFKNRIALLLISVVLCIACPGFSAERKIQLIEEAVTSEIAKIDEIEHATSEKAPDDGYVANETVVSRFDAMKYHYTGGRYDNAEIRFRLFSPEKIESGRKYPLIVWLHGVGESDDDNKRQLSHMQAMIRSLSGPQRLDIFILATQCPKDNRSWHTSVSYEGQGDAPLTITKEILNAVLDEYPIDRDAVSLIGICSGASAAWDWVLESPELFASLGVCSAQPPDSHKIHSLQGVKIWIFNNIDDAASPIAPLRQFVPRLEKAGVDVLLTEGIGAHNSWEKALRDQKLVPWMALQKRGSSTPPPGSPIHDYYFKRPSGLQSFLLFCLPLLLIGVALMGRSALWIRKRRGAVR